MNWPVAESTLLHGSIWQHRRKCKISVACCRRSWWRHLWLKVWGPLGTLHQKSIRFFLFISILTHLDTSCRHSTVITGWLFSVIFTHFCIFPQNSHNVSLLLPDEHRAGVITFMMPANSVSSNVWLNYINFAHIWFCCSSHRKIEQVSSSGKASDLYSRNFNF
jgi:hypothetical protein